MPDPQKPWQFQPGHKLAKGGKRPGAGRPSKGKKAASQIVREIIEGNAQRLATQYIKRALDKYGDRVLCHAIDKLLPDEQIAAQPTTIIHQFIKFTSHNDSAQLPTEGLSSAILVSNDRTGLETGGNDLASPQRQRQDSVEFRSFANVSRERG